MLACWLLAGVAGFLLVAQLGCSRDCHILRSTRPGSHGSPKVLQSPVLQQLSFATSPVIKYRALHCYIGVEDMRVISTRARIGTAILGVTAACCKSVQQPAKLTSRTPTATIMNPSTTTRSPEGISIRPATASEAYPLLTNMINDAFREYHVLHEGDGDRVTKDGKQGTRSVPSPPAYNSCFLIDTYCCVQAYLVWQE